MTIVRFLIASSMIASKLFCSEHLQQTGLLLNLHTQHQTYRQNPNQNKREEQRTAFRQSLAAYCKQYQHAPRVDTTLLIGPHINQETANLHHRRMRTIYRSLDQQKLI